MNSTNIDVAPGELTVKVLELPCELGEDHLEFWLYGDGSGDIELELSGSDNCIVLSAENQYKLAQALLKSCKMAQGGMSQDG